MLARMPEQAIRVTVTTWICKLKIFMKIILLMSLVSLFLSPAFAGTAVKLSCSLRKSVTISKFHYKLSTMKWGDHFRVASGIRQAQTTGNVPFRVTRFQNGDDLVFSRTARPIISSIPGWRHLTAVLYRRPIPTRLLSYRAIRKASNRRRKRSPKGYPIGTPLPGTDVD